MRAHDAAAPDTRTPFRRRDAGLHMPASAGASVEFQLLRLPPNGWVPNNRRLPVIVYRRALLPDRSDPASLADAFDARFSEHGWPSQWRDAVFDYHHFHSTAHEVMAVFAGRAELMLGGPGGHLLRVAAGDALLLPAGTGHCLVSRADGFQVIGGYPAGQQWDIRRDALTPHEASVMETLPFPPSDPLCGDCGPVIDYWVARGDTGDGNPQRSES